MNLITDGKGAALRQNLQKNPRNIFIVIKLLWRPIFIIVQFLIVSRRELNGVKIPQGEENKSANRWGNLRAKGGVVPPSVFNLPYSCEQKNKIFTQFRCLLLHVNITFVSMYCLFCGPSSACNRADRQDISRHPPYTRGQAKKADHAGSDGLYVIVSVGSRLNTEGGGGEVSVSIHNKKNNK